MAEKWIQEAVKKQRRGAFTKWCQAHGYKGVTQECIEEAKKIAHKTKNKTLMGQALFAQRAQKGF